jgi:hypothetical protein
MITPTSSQHILLPNAQQATQQGTSPFPIFNTNPLGAVPKKNSNKWHLIMHLSHPPDSSINDGIPVEEFSLKYISVDTATDAIMELA